MLWFGFKIFRWATTVRLDIPYSICSHSHFVLTARRRSLSVSLHSLNTRWITAHSLGGQATEYLYGGGKVSYTIPVCSPAKPIHQLNVRSAAVGTILITEASSAITNVTMEMTLRSDDKTSLDDVKTLLTDPESETTPLVTTRTRDINSCFTYLGRSKYSTSIHTLSPKSNSTLTQKSNTIVF